jgi:hypothetical protein
MKFAEKKLGLFQIIANMNVETTDNLAHFVTSVKVNSEPTIEDIAFFEKRRDDFFVSGEKGFTKQESLAMLRKQMK